MEDDIMNAVSTTKVGNLKRRAICTGEDYSSTKAAKLEVCSGDTKRGLSVSSGDEEDLIARRKKDWWPYPGGFRNWLSVDGSVSSDDDEEDLKLNSSKKRTHTYSNPTQETAAHEADTPGSLRDELTLNFKRSNKVVVSRLKPISVETRSTSTAINPEGKIELPTSKEDIVSRSSQEFLCLLLTDIEEQENQNFKASLEFLPFTPLWTPQKNDRQVVSDKSAQAHDNLRICAPKKKTDVINKSRNAFASLRKTRKNDLYIWADREASVRTNSLINSVKKSESSKRKLNFQDLCLSDVKKETTLDFQDSCLSDIKKENDSDDSGATFCDANDILESRAVNESVVSDLEENKEKKNDSIYECTHNQEDCKEDLEPNKSFPFIFSGHLNGGNCELKSKANVQGPIASLIEGGSQERSKIISELIFGTTNNATVLPESSKLNSKKSRSLSDVEEVDCSNSPLESDDSDDSDMTLSDLKTKLASKKESLKSKKLIDLHENRRESIFGGNVSGSRNRHSSQEAGNVSGASEKSFPFIFSQPQRKPEGKINREQKLRDKPGHLNGGNCEQKTKSNAQGSKARLIEGGSQEKSKIISELIFETTNNATLLAELTKLNSKKSKSLSDLEKVDCSNLPIEVSADSDDSDVTISDLKNKLASTKESLKSTKFIDLDENRRESIFGSNVSRSRNRQSSQEEGNVSGASEKSFPFIFSQPQRKPESKINREQKLRDKPGHLNRRNCEQKSKSNAQGSKARLIEGGSQEKNKIISEPISETTNNATAAAESPKLNPKKSRSLCGVERIYYSNSPKEVSDDSDDCDVTLSDLKHKLVSKKKSLKSRKFIDLDENRKESIVGSNVSSNRDRQNNQEEGASEKSFPFFFSQPQCKPKDTINPKPNTGLRDLIYFENRSQKNGGQGQPKDFIFLKDKPSKDEEKTSENRFSKGKSLLGLKDLFFLKDDPEKKQRDSICLKGHPNKGSSNTFENANSNYANQTVDDLRSIKADFSFSQPQCKADEWRLNKKENRIRAGLWKLSDKNPTLSWIEQQSQELLLNTYSQPPPIREKGKTSSGASYEQFFQGRASHPSKLERKLKSCDEQKKDMEENDSTRNLFAVENICKQNQENERARFGLSPLEIKEGPTESFNSDCRFYESKGISIKNNEALLRPYSQPQGGIDRLEIQNKHAQINCAVQKLALSTNFLEYSSQSLPTAIETKRSERTGTDCKIKSSQESKITSNKETSPENFKGFAKQSISKSQRCQYLITADSDQKASASENESNRDLQEVGDFSDEDSSQAQKASSKQRNGSREDLLRKQQEAFDDGSNTETENWMINEDSRENFEKILELEDALAKIKMKIERPKENLLSEMNREESSPLAASNSQNSEVSQLKENTNQITFQDFCVRKMKDSQHYSTLQNKDSLFVNANEFEDFAERHLTILSNQVLAHAEQADLSQQSSLSIAAQEDFTRRTFINRTQSNGTLSTGSKENFTLPEKRLRRGLNHVIRDKSLLCREKDSSTSSQLSRAARLKIIEKLSNVFVRLRDDVARKKSPILEIRNQSDWSNCSFINNRVTMKPLGEATTTIINFHRKASKLNFNLIIFLLGKIINMLSEDSSTTKRELYYQLIRFVKSQSQVNNAVDQISCLLDEPPWQLGITAMSKGLIYGDLKIVLASAQAINCNVPGGSLVPQDVQKITQLISDAYFILIVEKDAIFQKLLKEDLPNKLTRPFILITGKGYPDLNLRFFIKKLTMAMSVPVFILVDADPYGIDIMLTYRFGSLRMSHLNEYLAIPNARWIGVYPSEIIELNISHQPLTEKDETKIKNILKRPYCASFSKLKDEMEVLLENNFKAEIEGLLKSDTFLRDFYLPNKFLTQDYV